MMFRFQLKNIWLWNFVRDNKKEENRSFILKAEGFLLEILLLNVSGGFYASYMARFGVANKGCAG